MEDVKKWIGAAFVNQVALRTANEKYVRNAGKALFKDLQIWPGNLQQQRVILK
jgi:hypothetical protein